MTQVKRVRRLAGVLYIAAFIVMVFVGAGTLIGLVIQFPTAATLQTAYPAFSVSAEISQGLIIASVIIGLVPMIVWVWTLDQMRRLFACYKIGAVLSDRSAHFIQRIGFGLMGIGLAQLALVPIQSLLLTISNPPGERSLSIGLTSDMLGFLMAAGMMIIIGWAMREASDVAAENRAFV